MKSHFFFIIFFFLFTLNGMEDKKEKSQREKSMQLVPYKSHDRQYEQLMRIALYHQPNPPITSAGDRFALVPYKPMHEILDISEENYERIHPYPSSIAELTLVTRKYIETHSDGHLIHHDDGSVSDKLEFERACTTTTNSLQQINNSLENAAWYHSIVERLTSRATLAQLTTCILATAHTINCYSTPQKRIFLSSMLSIAFITKVISGIGLTIGSIKLFSNWIYGKYRDHLLTNALSENKDMHQLIEILKKAREEDKKAHAQAFTEFTKELMRLETNMAAMDAHYDLRCTQQETRSTDLESELQQTKKSMLEQLGRLGGSNKKITDSVIVILEEQEKLMHLFPDREVLAEYSSYIDAIQEQLHILEKRQQASEVTKEEMDAFEAQVSILATRMQELSQETAAKLTVEDRAALLSELKEFIPSLIGKEHSVDMKDEAKKKLKKHWWKRAKKEEK